MTIKENLVPFSFLEVGSVVETGREHIFQEQPLSEAGKWVGEGDERKFVPNHPVCPGTFLITTVLTGFDGVGVCTTPGCGVERIILQ